MNCSRCGTVLGPDSRFCPRCGAAVPIANPPATAPPGSPPWPPSPAYGRDVPGGGIPPATGTEAAGLPAPAGWVGECIRNGWTVFQREGPMLVIMYLVYTLLTAGPGLTFRHSFGEDHPLDFSIRFGSGVLSLFLYPGFIVAGLKAVRGGRVEFVDLFAGFPRWRAVLAWGFLGGFAIALSTLFFILPGVIVALGLSQAGYLVFDRGLGGLDALKASWRLMIGYRMRLLLLTLALVGINLLGLLALCIGLLVTAPLTAVILAVFYERVRQWNGGVLRGESPSAGAPMPPGITAS